MPGTIQDYSVEYIPGNTGCAVIFLPGLQGGPLELGSIPRQFQKLGHTICHPLIRGYSAGTESNNYEQWLDDLNFITNLLYQNHHKVAIVGLSMGATLALAYQIEYEDSCALCLLSPVLAYDGWNVAWYYPLLRVLFLLRIKNWFYSEREPYGLKNQEIRRRVAKQVREQEITEVGSASLSARHLYQGLRLIDFVKSSLEGLKTDLLIICSVDDDVSSPKTAEMIEKGATSSLIRTIWLGNSYHIITLDNEREIVINETVKFIHNIFKDPEKGSNIHPEINQLRIRLRSSE